MTEKKKSATPSDYKKQTNETLCQWTQEGDPHARMFLCTKNKRLVAKYAHRYHVLSKNNLEFDDLEQAGFIGLLAAIEKYDAGKNAAFSTYAVYWIRQMILQEIYDNGFMIRIPPYLMARISKVSAAENRYANEEIQTKIRLISAELDISEEDVLQCLELKEDVLHCTSLNQPIGEDLEIELLDLTPCAYSTEEMVMDALLKEDLTAVFDTLKEIEKEIIQKRFGLETGYSLQLEEIAKEYGMTVEAVRKIEAKAMRKLQHPSRAKKLAPYLKK